MLRSIDLSRQLEDWKKEGDKWKARDVNIFHTTFGAPPVGDHDFQKYFNRHFNQQSNRHESWSIYHQRDLVPSCFQYCGTLAIVRRLCWWGDWRGVGHRIRLTREVDFPADTRSWSKKAWDFVKTSTGLLVKGFLIIDILVAMYIWSWALAVPAAFLYSPYHLLRHWRWPRRVTTPARNWGGGRPGRDPPPSAPLGTEYHSLERYIELMTLDKFHNETQVMKWDNERGEVPDEWAYHSHESDTVGAGRPRLISGDRPYQLFLTARDQSSSPAPASSGAAGSMVPGPSDSGIEP